jgi:hypothetical protein
LIVVCSGIKRLLVLLWNILLHDPSFKVPLGI